ncbi:MAG: hypothetical protein K8S55_04245 [Phycisphaerae bacterium]|nr:hypothetical protein [Phycisphaerae bacterium]
MNSSQETEKTLLHGRYRPVTGTIGFLECPAKHAAKMFYKWRYRTYTRDGRELHIEPLRTPNMGTALDALLPLMTYSNRWLFLETTSQWCAFFGNRWQGTDSSPIGPLAGHRCGCRGVRATSVPNIPMKKIGEEWFGSYGAEILEVYRPEWTEMGNTERSICAMNDGGPWCFETYGEPYGFEDTEAYSARRKRDRFTHDMLESYLQHLGIEAYDEAFYRPGGQCSGFLVSVQGDPFPDQHEYTLDDLNKQSP